MKRATTIAILGALVVGTVAIGAGARAIQRNPPDDASNRHASRSETPASVRAPGASHAAPPLLSIEVDGSAVRAAPPEEIDWGNPYDLMLHGIKPGKTRNMR